MANCHCLKLDGVTGVENRSGNGALASILAYDYAHFEDTVIWALSLTAREINEYCSA
jgi:hypothetical protein